MKAENMPKERQSRGVFGFVKLKAKMIKMAVFIITKGHSPYAGALSMMSSFPLYARPTVVSVSFMHKNMHKNKQA